MNESENLRRRVETLEAEVASLRKQPQPASSLAAPLMQAAEDQQADNDAEANVCRHPNIQREIYGTPEWDTFFCPDCGHREAVS